MPFEELQTLPSDQAAAFEQIENKYKSIGAQAIDILEKQWNPRTSAAKTREHIALQEQLIQDFLHYIFQPMVRSSPAESYLGGVEVENILLKKVLSDIRQLYEESKLPTFSLIAAHYRSPISVKGRRSSFVVDRDSLKRNLQACLGEVTTKEFSSFSENIERHPLLLDLWHAVFLEQYFRLFGKPRTMNEWVLEKLRDKCRGVLVRFKSADEQCRFWPESKWICVDFPRALCEILVDSNLTRAFHIGIIQSVNDALKDAGGAKLARALSPPKGGPSETGLYEWFDILRETNVRAFTAFQAGERLSKLERRNRFVTGKLFFENKAFAESLLLNFDGQENLSQDAAFTMIHEIVKVFQAMLFYCSLYGDEYLTFPFWKREMPGCSLTFMKHEDPQNRGWEWMLPWASRLSKIAVNILPNVMEHAKTCMSDAQKGPFQYNGETGIRWPSGVGVDQIWAAVQSEIAKAESREDGGKLQDQNKAWYEVLLALVMNLASAKHEGQGLGFSFLLGNPHSLVHDLMIEHEFLLRKEQGPAIFKLGPDKLAIAYSLSLIKGNYAFLQDPELALFVCYPGFPPEITHIVRLPLAGVEQRTRRGLLAATTKGKTDLLAAATHGNGRADLLFNGVLIGTYSERDGWKPANSYDEFWRMLEIELNRTFSAKALNGVAPVLKGVVERISGEPGHGALFALGSKKRVKALTDEGVPLTTVFDSVEQRAVGEIGENLLFQVSIEDGGTIIEVPSGKISGRWQLRGINPEKHEISKGKTLADAWQQEGGPYRWENWHKTLVWGTRHMAGLGASLTLGSDGLIIIISSDGPVHVLKDGKPVQYRKVKDGKETLEDLVFGD